MANFAWIKLLRDLSPVSLTVRAQALPVNDRGRLRWQEFFPRTPVDSVNLADILTIDDRAAADRREWNAPGRLIPLEIPSYRELEMVPIESYFLVDEREMQHLSQQTGGNDARIQDILAVRIPRRVTSLVNADYRRLELDVFRAWALGTIVARNPQDASKTYSASYGIDSSRYQTAGTAWNDGGLNAYNEFIAWAKDAQDAIGPIEGAMMRQTTYDAILADAPELPNGVLMTASQLDDRIRQDLRSEFMIDINENSLDEFADGGIAKTRVKVWTAEKVAAIPAGKRVGYSGFAPVVRAQSLAREVPEARVEEDGVTIFYIEENDGKTLKVQGQLNAFPVPNDQDVFVIDVGV